MQLFKQGNIAVRELADEDAPLLVKWLSDPRVLAYYEGRDRPHDLESVRKHFYNRTAEFTPCIVEFGNSPIGYIQFYSISEEEKHLYGCESFPGKIYGMDQFIGEVEYWNKGIGTALIKAMVLYLLIHERADKIVMDPQTWNERALHVYEKCGFVKKKILPKHEWHEGEYRDSWLMEYEKPEDLRAVTILSRLGELYGYRNEEIAYFDLYDVQAGKGIRHFILLNYNVKFMYEPWGWVKKEWYVDLVAIEYSEDDKIRLTDLYLDLYIEENGPTYRMVDLNDLAVALVNNEVNVHDLKEPLINLQRFLDDHLHGSKNFPPEAIQPYLI